MSRRKLPFAFVSGLWLAQAAPALGQTAPAATAEAPQPAPAAPPLTPPQAAAGAAAATTIAPTSAATPASSASAPVGSASAPVGSASAPAGGLPETGASDSFSAADPAASEIMAGEEAPKLELYGFADVQYFHPLSSQKNILRQYVASYPSFFVGHFNLYLASQLSENWRSLAEVRFVYSPVGDEDKQAADGTFPATDSTANDYAELQRSFGWGGIEVQRVWLEYQPFDFMSIRAGQWFTPYGFWNDDHGSPTIIGVHKPFPISDAMFPEKQTGVEVHGKYFIDSTALGYALTLSNGRGPYDAVRDLDNNKAIGGRLYVETTAVGNLDFGIAAYRGRYTASTKRYRVDTDSSGNSTAAIYRTLDSAYEELSLGADVRFLWKGLHVQAEAMMNEAAYDDEARPKVVGFDPRPTFAADYRRMGGYLLLGYRTPWLNLMPYGMVEYANFTNTDFAPPATAWTGGINLRPAPNVVLKAEYSAAVFHGVGSTGAGKDGLSYIGTQAAWAY
jgi:hypothetical protein